MKKYWFLSLFLVIALFTACSDKIIFEDVQEFSDYEWKLNDTCRFEANVPSVEDKYNIYFTVRHTNTYEYSNLWIKIFTFYPSGESQEDLVQIPMADPKGKWFGSGTGDALSHQVQIQANAIFPEVGKYRFEIIQFMRKDPMEEVMDAGLMIEKVE